MRWRRALGWTLGLTAAGALALALAYPRVTFWRARYWLGPDAKRIALVGLMRATPDGGSWELSDAVGSEEELLRFTAAGFLRERGDLRGVRVLVDLCYEYPEGHIKLDPQLDLERAIGGDPRIRDHKSADEWWTAVGSRLVYRGGGRWTVAPP